MKPFCGAFVLSFCLSLMLPAQSTDNPKVLIQTEMGDITVEIFVNKAPLTAENFLRYVDDNLFAGGSFYRVVNMENQPGNDVKIEVIQGGQPKGAKRFPSIAHETTEETGVLHLDGTISMARLNPGTASSEFFICVNDQPELDFGGKRNPDGQGFAAFGRVIRGMDIVRKIHKVPAPGQYLDKGIAIIAISRIDEKSLVPAILVLSVWFSI